MDVPAREALRSRGVTRRELEALDLVAQRWTNAEIAEQLGLSERTVESYVSSLLRKLSARRRLDLAAWARPAVPSMPEHLEGMEQRGPCIGRDSQLAQLSECWERATVRTTIAVIRGEAGIGKSRLSAAFAAEVARCGGRVVVGCCDAGHDRPFQPLIDAIVDDDRRHAVPGRAGRSGGSADLLDRLVPGRAGPSHDLVDPGGERAAVHAAIQAHFASIASEERLLLVIEDVQWASAGTRDVISRIARSPAEAPFMLVVTMREERGRGDDEFGRFLAGLVNLPAVETLSLGGLDLAAVGRLIDEVGSDLDPHAALAQTDGNPLYVRELAREGVASRALRDLVADRFARLRPDHLDLLDLAVVAGAQLDVPLLAAAADRPIDDVLDAAEQAEAAGLIASGGGPSRLVFAHDVFRAVREASLTAGRRVRLHARLAEALHRTVVDGQHLGRLARHACLGAPSFDSLVAAELARRAGDASADATDHGGAVEHYRRGLDALELGAHDDGALRAQLTIGLGSCLVLTGDGGGYAVLRDSALVARRRGDPVGLARAFCAAAIIPGGSGFARALDPEFAAMAEDALATLPFEERAWRSRILAKLGVQLLITTDVERGTELLTEAVEAARALGDPLTLGRALLSFRFAGGPLDIEQRIACGEELIELGRQTGVNLFVAVGHQQLGWCWRELGDRDAMDAWWGAAAELLRAHDLEQLSQEANVALMDGELDGAEALADELQELNNQTGNNGPYVALLRLGIADARGQTVELAHLEQALFKSRERARPFNAAMLARSCARQDVADRAGALLADARRVDIAPRYGPYEWTATMCWWAETAVLIDDRDAAAELRRLLEPLAGRMVDVGPVVLDTVDRFRALLLMQLDDVESALEVAHRAVAASRRRRTDLFLGRELIVLAAARRRAGDAAESDRALQEGLAIAERTGAHVITGDARLLLGIEPRRAGPASGLALTRREREVLDLVRAGGTNAQVARALGISPATVRKHLEHAFHKLDVSTRTAAVARAGAEPGTRPISGAAGS